MAYRENAFSGDLIRWRHDISHQVESSERDENAWVLGWVSLFSEKKKNFLKRWCITLLDFRSYLADEFVDPTS